MGQSTKIKWPFGSADVTAVAYAATMALTTANTRTVATIAQMTGAGTINVTIGAEQAVGDELFIKSSSDGTGRVLTWGTGFTGNAYTHVANKSAIHRFVYNGTTWELTGSNQTN